VVTDSDCSPAHRRRPRAVLALRGDGARGFGVVTELEFV
jgi:hypothetical protein